MSTAASRLEARYPVSMAHLPELVREALSGAVESPYAQVRLPEALEVMTRKGLLPAYIRDLVRVEEAVWDAFQSRASLSDEVTERTLNPSLHLVEVSWTGLAELLDKGMAEESDPLPGQEALLVFVHPGSLEVKVRAASHDDLLAMKITAENLEVRDVAADHDLPPVRLWNLLDRAAARGVLIAPTPKIARDPQIFAGSPVRPERFQRPKVFTLQWHITQACDLKCKHCYDRSSRSSLGLDQAMAILDQFEDFCSEQQVRGKITFTGGNPLLYPHFERVYQEAAGRGFSLSILGNPASREVIERLAAIQTPGFYQVSLEGLPEHNDAIRQPGHFTRTLDFLQVLQDLKVPSQVMLTLTRDNMGQVLPLAERLRGLTDSFSFNRLSMVGEGARLMLPERKEYEAFLREYRAAARSNPILGIKDNLFNILRWEDGSRPFGGCTGFGCGAAFNFVALLPDGEVHACRKFPSWIGNIFEASLHEIYESSHAKRYRAGSSACAGCSLRPVCGGCQAVVSSMGLDPARDLDPHCFFPQDCEQVETPELCAG